MDKQNLDEMKKVALEYIRQERAKLQAQYNFLDAVQKKRGLSALNKTTSDAIATRAKTSLESYVNIS
jgi:hypothetical protein